MVLPCRAKITFFKSIHTAVISVNTENAALLVTTGTLFTVHGLFIIEIPGKRCSRHDRDTDTGSVSENLIRSFPEQLHSGQEPVYLLQNNDKSGLFPYLYPAAFPVHPAR